MTEIDSILGQKCGYAGMARYRGQPVRRRQWLRKGELMSKFLASALAQALSLGIIVAGMPTVQAMPASRLQSIKTEQAILVSDLVSNDAPRISHRRLYSRIPHDFPYMPSGFNVSGYDAGERQFCGFGSYVACAYAGTYCWRRCN
jgi:hypothetical protein